MRIISFILILVLFAVGVSFAVINATPVKINYYFDFSVMPLSWLLILVFTLGCLIGVLVGIYLLIRANFKNYRLRQKLMVAEKEIENLRAIPLQDKVQ